ncbi:hypothetical protein COW36_22865 [bacterium (Candidatus Blackallbacteria) CG17_big_fil_post_rev_8_21_14_2_50_48_46]|uniref:Chemotaxis phosphatase CheX-like domain-containing protein n=1 Tax=bacterium (Candidatus Blackallbacteria) CG17_big_fil_post_rev_8_21_14_2_50_48_46 TaxID=2014261 RepID=A0A2M7FXS4_9BACT|nr:MAG: hypothetical protein COW64_15935 [bacterium (Candidatus Blackallbacteria) CG18_big_fil_WC_8_21_14_2_50_49_26]PIW14093.1 MAG: hypothetical protein COW36_22865 [bacterium (Candidatus Blackallbacteria) CG17_big_fil_post_rev_8_21_14_2_50_48_46]PIW45823.1 MAG: hypothetical protein COW20_18530 [bacterium (Candidatus Blackallbacteria) CG13_big_fil_rev_8_21_14_2_50_49_14]
MALEKHFIRAVNSAVSNLLSTMIPMDFKLSEESAQNPANTQGFSRELVGTIDIRGGLSGSISVMLSYPLAISMASLLLEEELDEVNEDVYEAVAEITNMIAGGVKTSLSQHGSSFVIGLPQVFDLGGDKISAFPEAGKGQFPINVPVETLQGAFCVASLLQEEAFA